MEKLVKNYELLHVKTLKMFSTRYDTKWAERPQWLARIMKFWILEREGFYYLCSENKGADQLCSYHAADLHFCFHIFKKQVFS